MAVEQQDLRVFNGEGELYLRRKVKKSGKFKAVLFLHGVTLPSSSCFDLDIEGYSWANYLALEGFDVFLLDFRGYGLSYKPEDKGKLVCSVEEALTDVKAAIEHILSMLGTSTICLVGWSWGACLAGLCAEKLSSIVERVLLHAPGFKENTSLALELEPKELLLKSSGYVEVTADDFKRRWLREVSYEGQVDKNVLEYLIARLFRNGVVRVPSGPWLSIYEMYRRKKPLFNPEGIKCPVLITRGEYDNFALQNDVIELFHSILVSHKQLALLQGGGHFIHLERERLKLYKLSSFFLHEETI